MLCFKPGDRTHLLYRLRPWRGRRGERRGFAWTEYRDLIVATHQQLRAPLVWIWDNLNVHSTHELTDFIAANRDWLHVVHLPSYAPELNPTEGVWSLLKRSLTDFAAADLDHLTRVVKRKLKKIQYRPHLLDGCLAQTGLTITTPVITPTAITNSTSVTRNRGQFPSEQAVLKVLYLAVRNLADYRRPNVGIRSSGWKQALQAFTIYFEGRIPTP